MIQILPDILAVEVPRDTNFDIQNDQDGIFLAFYWDEPITMPLPPGNWTILFTTDEMTEEQAAGIVEKDSNGYIDYSDDFPYNMISFDWAKGSFGSLLRSKCLDSDKKNYLILQNKK